MANKSDMVFSVGDIVEHRATKQRGVVTSVWPGGTRVTVSTGWTKEVNLPPTALELMQDSEDE